MEVGGTGGGEHAAIGDLDLWTAGEQEQQVVCTAIDGRPRADTGTESTNGGIEAKDKQAGCERTSLKNATAKSIGEGQVTRDPSLVNPKCGLWLIGGRVPVGWFFGGTPTNPSKK